MRKFFIVLFSLFIFCPNFVWAGSCSKSGCNAGEYCDSILDTCTQCPTGKFCTGGTSQPQACPAPHTESDEGTATSDKCYYSTKKSDPLGEGGVRGTKTTIQKAYKDGSAATEWHLDCNNPSLECSGYHPDDEALDCVSNYKSCTLSNWWQGIQIWLPISKNFSACFPILTKDIIANHPDTTLPVVTRCDEKSDIYYYPSLVPGWQPITTLCNDKLYNCEASAAGDTASVEGRWNWDITTPTNNGVSKADYSNCTCNKLETRDNGKYTTKCSYISGTSTDTIWETGNDCELILECNDGYCDNQNDPNKCTAIPVGYYTNKATDKRSCLKCPGGATSDGGATATSKQACYIQRGVTKFYDKNGNFTLPGTGKINFH